MDDVSEKKMNDGLDCYDPETRVFPLLAQKVKNRQNLSKRDILLILKWKLGRIKNNNSKTVAVDNMAAINRSIRLACGADRKTMICVLNALNSIPGIGLASATAILTVCYPDLFTIIDQRVLENLNLFPSKLATNKRVRYNADDWTASDYIDEYLPAIKRQSERWGCTLRDADRALWGLSVSRRIEEVITSSAYKL